MSLIVDEICDRASLAAIRAEWSALIERVPSRNPFVTPQFMLPYLDYIGTRYNPRVLVARENGRVTGLLPTFERASGRARRLIRRVSFPIHGTSPPFELVVEDDRDDVVRAFASHWRNTRTWDLIELSNVPATSKTESLMHFAVPRAGLRMASLTGRVSVYVATQGTWEDYWRTVPRYTRAASKRSNKLCAEAGDVRFVAYPGDIDSIARAIEWVNDITRRSWKTSGDPVVEDAARSAFLTSLAAERMLSVSFVTINDRPVAHLIDIVHKMQLNAFHTAYDLDFVTQGPTTLLLQRSIQECFRRGYVNYDLLGEPQLHLRRWASGQVQYRDLRITRTGAVSRLRADLFCRVRDGRVRRSRRFADKRKTDAKHAARSGEEGGANDG